MKTSEQIEKAIKQIKKIKPPKYTDLSYGLDMNQAIKCLKRCYYLAYGQEKSNKN